MGIAALIVLLIVELFFLVWSITTKKLHKQEKNIVRISEFVLITILLLTGIFEWGFRYTGITVVLLIQAVISVVALKRNKAKPFKTLSAVSEFILVAVLYAVSTAIAIICPQYVQPAISGNYQVDTAKYTWVDENRTETYSDKDEKRELTVEFWYPENPDENCPLVVFSHGAFGFAGSNHSTFEELASNGYVVASIGHTYQAFYTLSTNGRLTTVNTEFLNTAMAVQNSDDVANEFEISHSWLDLRTDDENFVIDTIIEQAKTNSFDALFSIIDTQHIGLFGHSLGGASSAQLGRLRYDIDAVIVLDGTMMGEEIARKDGISILNETPYPVPLLNVYAENHYSDAMALSGENYPNFYASANAVNASEVMVIGSGHLNFTDLPLFSPFLANILGVGTVDARYCIETTNELVLEYFNCYLKDKETPHFEKEY